MTSVASLLEGKRIVICAGSGGVGKTTTAAALGLGMAERGLRVAVVTIDPARRLATSLGLEELGNEPRQVDPERLASRGVEVRGRAVGDDARREAHVRRADREARARTSARATRCSPTGSTSSSPARWRARRSSRRSRSSTSSTRRAASTCSCSTRRRRATRSTSSTRPQRLRRLLRRARDPHVPAARPGFSGKVLGRGTGVVFSLLQRVTGVDLLQDLSVVLPHARRDGRRLRGARSPRRRAARGPGRRRS